MLSTGKKEVQHLQKSNQYFLKQQYTQISKFCHLITLIPKLHMSFQYIVINMLEIFIFTYNVNNSFNIQKGCKSTINVL